ncbi:hypothetical protein Ccrd_023927 [Cynara cardunculus var. scolymus]|uniref:Uncharacterized protein n=1 Tax=Cynara cardunculus var. scolymus TaxID=59895 RepID=A0A124PLF9_CYNCS|nr:hypothetical protein Ccrd_023927 [Cynara cardunculus var. scolymus]
MGGLRMLRLGSGIRKECGSFSNHQSIQIRTKM